jgi:hypothetical protein
MRATDCGRFGRLIAYPETVGDCPDFAESAEQNGTVPLSSTVFGLALILQHQFLVFPQGAGV